MHVAIAFDDGPIPKLADKFIAIFEKEGIKVTFARFATHIIQYLDTIRAQLAAIHEIVNHSYDHKRPSKLSDEELVHEIADAQSVIADITKIAPKGYWSPYRETDERGAAIAEKAGIAYHYPVHNLVSSDDWNREANADQIRERSTTGVKENNVILFREWHQETYEQLPAIIQELCRQNCVFMAFSELKAYAETHSALPQ